MVQAGVYTEKQAGRIQIQAGVNGKFCLRLL